MNEKANILVLEEKNDLYWALSRYVNTACHSLLSASAVEDAMSSIKANDISLFIVNESRAISVEKVISHLNIINASSRFLVVSSQCNPDAAELAIQNGAIDYIERNEAELYIAGILDRIKNIASNRSCSKTIFAERFGIIGDSQPLLECFNILEKASKSTSSVLITGETGTGKELFARAIHEMSPRAANPLIVVDCASLPETLVESLLFGYAKGAFTGADSNTEGLIKRAHGGTLFLDEVAELPLDTQKKFLRVLQEKRFRPVGGKEEMSSDFRLVAATNKDLGQLSKDGQFRSDLLYRIKSLRLKLPPLREREQDKVKIARHFLDDLNRRNLTQKAFSPEFLQKLEPYDWPGNIRELENIISGTFALAGDSPVIYPEHLPQSIRARIARLKYEHKRETAPRDGDGNLAGATLGVEQIPPFKQYRRQFITTIETEYFKCLNEICKADIRSACSMSRLSRARLYELYKKYGIQTKSKPGV